VCGFNVIYGDLSSIQGGLYTDVVTLADTSLSATAVFGAILYESGNFEPVSIDGIMGVAYPSLNCNPAYVLSAVYEF